MSGTYIGALFSVESRLALAHWVSSQAIPNQVDPKTYHVTLIYSRETLKVPLVRREVDWSCWADKFYVFDNRQEPSQRSLVLALRSPELIDRHWYYRLNHGAKHDYPEFVPHVTLSYNVPDDFDLNRLELPKFNLRLREEYVAKLDTTWTGTDRRELER